MAIIRCPKCQIDDRKDFKVFYPAMDEEYLDGAPCPRCGNPLELDPEEAPDA
jgi:endogenous inhibitor of DNA gyrase (YacG/DUF329 family)